jgi:hypothetical protein
MCEAGSREIGYCADAAGVPLELRVTDRAVNVEESIDCVLVSDRYAIPV